MPATSRAPRTDGSNELGTANSVHKRHGWIDSNAHPRIAENPGSIFSSLDEWKLACRVAESKGMSKSDLLPRFLLYVCELSLCGRADEITEQRIGNVVFNRPADYSPGEDNIVRSYARTMRKRLEDHFAGEGRHESMRVHIPRGGYVPVFERVDKPYGSGSDNAEQKQTTSVREDSQSLRAVPQRQIEQAPTGIPPWIRSMQPNYRGSALMIAPGLLLGALIALALTHWTPSKTEPEASPAHAIWSQIFEPTRTTLIVPADSGLGILENLSKRSVSVEQYASGSYLQEMAHAGGLDAGNLNDLGRQRYTSVVDLNIAARIVRLPEYPESRAQIRYARNVTTEDIKGSNAILIGSKHTNPWVALYEPAMNFTLEYTQTVDQSFIINHAPRPDEQATYANGTADSASPTFGVIAYLPSLDGTGHVLIVEGLNMAATQAAADLLFKEKTLGPILRQSTNEAGILQPFELLVRTSSIGATSPGAEVLALRVHRQ